MDTVGEGEGGTSGESSMETATLYAKSDSQCKFAVWLRELQSDALWQSKGGGMGWEGLIERGAVCTLMADSCWYVADTYTVKQLSSN